jgi:hypothetical protein
MKHTLSRLFLVAVLAATATFAADIAGKWKTTFNTPNGVREGSMTLKVDGDKLTGTMDSQRGSVEIQDGKVHGDEISFSVTRRFQDNEVKIQYKGKVSGNEMKLTMTMGDREMEMTAKKE